MPSIFVRDSLRAVVEASTGGQCTVLYSQSEIPSYFFVLPAFNLEDIDPALGSGLHPAFIINGRSVSRLFIGQYQGALVQNNIAHARQLVSLPGMAPYQFPLNVPEFYGSTSAMWAAENAGPGYHVMTNVEWAAVALWCRKNGFSPHGNTAAGRDITARHERGIPADAYGLVKTGTGPSTWRHNESDSGICDLVGNIGEWVAGLRLVDGEVQVYENNDAASWLSSNPDSNVWKAINFSTGALVNPGSTGTVKVDSVAPSAGEYLAPKGPFVFSATRTNNLSPLMQYNFMDFAALNTGPATLKVLGLAPALAGCGGGIWVRNYGIINALRGGAYSTGADASLWTMTMHGNFMGGNARLVKY